MKPNRITLLLLAVCMLFLGCACGGGGEAAANGKYRILEVLESQSFSIGFRNDDFVRYYVDAALAELAADGTIHSIALRWFSEDVTTFRSDEEALDRLGNLPSRTLIVGLDADAFPMSYQDGEGYSGFDADVARAVCDRLGWTLRFIPIEPENVYVELSSGNVDCAWGGLVLDGADGKYTVLTSYMQNELALVVGGDSGIRGRSGLKGKTLAIDVSAQYMDVLDGDEALKNSLGKISRLTGGAQACFEALDSGAADAIIVYSAAVRYYGK